MQTEYFDNKSLDRIPQSVEKLDISINNCSGTLIFKNHIREMKIRGIPFLRSIKNIIYPISLEKLSFEYLQDIPLICPKNLKELNIKKLIAQAN